MNATTNLHGPDICTTFTRNSAKFPYEVLQNPRLLSFQLNFLCKSENFRDKISL